MWRAGRSGRWSAVWTTRCSGLARNATGTLRTGPKQTYGKLRPTRPGEYLLMDTTRLDVFAFDPFTLKWVQAELTVSMDWYDRCICVLRLTPVSTKAIDAAAVLYQSFRPQGRSSASSGHASGSPPCITAVRMRTWSIRACRSCGCLRPRCSSTA